MKTPPEPSELVIGMSHKEMLSIMLDNNIFCGHDRFARIPQDAQRRALSHRAMERMAEDAQEMGLYDIQPEEK